jgi:hypothetical protein
VWHVLHRFSQVQGRLDRRLAELQAQTATVHRQVARLAAGQRPRGRRPVTDLAAHSAQVAQVRAVADGLRYLGQQLHTLLDVVVLGRDGVLDRTTRQGELTALLDLLAEVRDGAPPAQQAEVSRLHTHLTQALPGLLAFTAPLEAVQQAVTAELGAAAVALLGWAWQRRAILGPTAAHLLAALPLPWQAAAARLLTAWAGAVRASSAAETWHSLLRPHLAVHRTLSAGLLALLAVWHNHRVFTRGEHVGQNPLQLSGLTEAPTDWLVALGYPPGETKVVPQPLAPPATELAQAA